MNTSLINRRQFIKHTAVASVILGFPFLSRYANADDAPDFLGEALARMKKEQKVGVLIVISSKAEDASALAQILTHLLSPQNEMSHQIFCEAVFVCATAKQAAQRFPNFNADWTICCIEPSGKLTEGASLALNQFIPKFGETVKALVHGKEGERLRACAKSQRELLDAKTRDRVDKAIENLGAQSSRLRELASQELVELTPRAPAVLALTAMTTSDAEVKTRIPAIFENVFAGAPDDTPSACLPFGAKWEGKAVAMPLNDPCPACGMAIMPQESRRFLRFLVEKGR